RMSEAPKKLESHEEVKSFIAGPGLSLVHFFAPWAPQCSQLNQVLVDLVDELKSSFEAAYLDAEEVAEASLAAKIKAAPTVVFYKNGREVDRLDGFKPAELRTLIVKHTTSGGGGAGAASGQSLNGRLKALINQQPLMLFMKGDPQTPRCGFSRTIVGMLNDSNVAFGSFDILSDDDVRQGLKEYSNWPTYPQLYLNGELLGGLDVVREEFKDAEFVASLPKRT
ncbi:hypothetical protein PFISCL1PPCAC_3764, partial [Pristionchus fissidentatus]